MSESLAHSTAPAAPWPAALTSWRHSTSCSAWSSWPAALTYAAFFAALREVGGPVHGRLEVGGPVHGRLEVGGRVHGRLEVGGPLHDGLEVTDADRDHLTRIGAEDDANRPIVVRALIGQALAELPQFDRDDDMVPQPLEISEA